MTTSKLNTRFVTGLQKPKPLKPITSSAPDVPSKYSVLACLEEAVATMDRLVTALTMKAPVDYAHCLLVAAKIRANSTQLEEMYKAQLDRAFMFFRMACIDDNLDLSVRMQLGFLVELRAMGWATSHPLNLYYTSRIPTSEQIVSAPSFGGVPTSEGSDSGVLGPGDVIKTSGKYPTPTKMPAKNYFKDEVVIKNHDSGKVSPGAKERLVQITGPNEEKIELAKTLIEDTIKRNSSPVRESVLTVSPLVGEPRKAGSNSSLNSSASDDSPRITPTGSRAALRKSLSLSDHKSTSYKHTVDVGRETITISCHNLDLLTAAMIALDRHFNGEKQNVAIQSGEPVSGITGFDSGDDSIDESDETPTIVSPQVRPKRLYTRVFMLDCCLSRASRMLPKGWEKIKADYPNIVKQNVVYFDGATYLKNWAESENKGFALSNEEVNDSD